MNYEVREIPKSQTYEWLLNKHYAKRIPSISYAFGLYDGGILIGVCTLGSPPSQALVKGICGGEYTEIVLELNRLCLNEGYNNGASYFISRIFKLIEKPKIIVSYADTSMHHNGYIYQASNFLYTGLSAERTEWYVEGLEYLHSKSLSDGETKETLLNKYGDKLKYRQRERKHRYVMIVADKRIKKDILLKLKYPVLPYPKGNNVKYDASYQIRPQGIMM